MKLLCPTASSASSVVCPEREQDVNPRLSPSRGLQHITGQKSAQTHCHGYEMFTSSFKITAITLTLSQCANSLSCTAQDMIKPPYESGLKHQCVIRTKSQDEFSHRLLSLWHEKQQSGEDDSGENTAGQQLHSHSHIHGLSICYKAQDIQKENG